ncbi:hypothetical protein T484DRAFT_1844161 [Baffinella frigidus]|nr:hypothetical protein T484DRAFT_1844161 [Cryptophyta sp. CCMP2293]
MGAETSSLSSQHLEDGAPLQPQLPKHESHGDGDIHEVVDRVFVSGLAGALNFPMLHQRGVTHVLNASHYDDCPHAYRMHEFSYMMLNLPESDKDGDSIGAAWTCAARPPTFTGST